MSDESSAELPVESPASIPTKGSTQLPIDARLSLRPFVEADDAEVSSWFADAGELRFFAGRRLRWPLDSGQWRSIRMDSSVTALTAILGDDQTPVGHAELVAESAAVVRLARYAVSPALREQGLGRAILNRLLAMVREQGYSVVTLIVHPDNSTAVLAYRTFGFEFDDSPELDPRTEPDAVPDRLVMSLRLEQ